VPISGVAETFEQAKAEIEKDSFERTALKLGI
jgi:hypothetical protein